MGLTGPVALRERTGEKRCRKNEPYLYGLAVGLVNKSKTPGMCRGFSFVVS